MLVKKEDFFSGHSLKTVNKSIALFKAEEDEKNIVTKVEFSNLCLTSPHSDRVYQVDLTIEYVTGEHLIELNSLYDYLDQFNKQNIYYEKLISTIFAHIQETAQPIDLSISAQIVHNAGFEIEIVKESQS